MDFLGDFTDELFTDVLPCVQSGGRGVEKAACWKGEDKEISACITDAMSSSSSNACFFFCRAFFSPISSALWTSAKWTPRSRQISCNLQTSPPCPVLPFRRLPLSVIESANSGEILINLDQVQARETLRTALRDNVTVNPAPGRFLLFGAAMIGGCLSVPPCSSLMWHWGATGQRRLVLGEPEPGV